MKQTGYVISRNKAKTSYFTSSSAYDNPSWVSLKEATSYPTAELADTAAKKLLRYGSYEARIVSFTEAMEFEFPEKEPNKTIGNVGNQDEMDDQMNPDEDQDEMTAQQQEEPCPECGHSPCTCDDYNDDDEDNRDVEQDVDVIISRDGETQRPGEEEERAWIPKRFLRHQNVMYNGEKYTVVSDPGTGTAVIKPVGGFNKSIHVRNEHLVPIAESELTLGQLRRILMDLQDELDAAKTGSNSFNEISQQMKKVKAQIAQKKKVTEAFKMPGKPPLDAQPSENKKTAIDLKPSPMIKYKDAAEEFDKPDTDLTTTGAMEHGEKVKVPAEVMSDLKAAIKSYDDEAEMFNTRDDNRASFCLTAAEAFKTLLMYLEIGTVESIKMAQLQVTSWMSPITNNLPVSVQKFVYMAGRKPSLKDIFNVKWEEKRS